MFHVIIIITNPFPCLYIVYARLDMFYCWAQPSFQNQRAYAIVLTSNTSFNCCAGFYRFPHDKYDKHVVSPMVSRAEGSRFKPRLALKSFSKFMCKINSNFTMGFTVKGNIAKSSSSGFNCHKNVHTT